MSMLHFLLCSTHEGTVVGLVFKELDAEFFVLSFLEFGNNQNATIVTALLSLKCDEFTNDIQFKGS